MTLPEALDPVSIEIVRNALISAAKEMSIVLKRTAYNYIINEGQDFSVGLFNAQGETVVALKNWTPSRGSILVFGEEEKLRWESRADLARSSKQE